MDDHRGRAEEELICRFRDGDAEAFESLYKDQTPVLTSRIVRRLPAHLARRVSVDDVLQETRIVAFERRRSFTGASLSDFRNWLSAIADNKANGALERHGAARRASTREVSRDGRLETGCFVSAGPSPSQQAIGTETRERIHEAMGRLSADYREIVHLVGVDRLSLTEAADRLGKSYDAVYKLHERALYRLTEMLARTNGGGRE